MEKYKNVTFFANTYIERERERDRRSQKKKKSDKCVCEWKILSAFRFISTTIFN